MSSELPPSIESGVPPVPAMPADDVNALAARVAALETRFSPNSWVFGTSFIKRAFGMWAHVFVAGAIIGIVVWGIFFVCALLFGFSIAGLTNR